ncbi:MAG: hypothetical protein DRJ40_06910 [Thermoprotei archaeon]|nr:MAG: hypothetical protein DRJ40_06910 [Thermoprotei archaeon]
MIEKLVLTPDYSSIPVKCGDKVLSLNYSENCIVDVREGFGEGKYLVKIPGSGIKVCSEVVPAWCRGDVYVIDTVVVHTKGIFECYVYVASRPRVYYRLIDELFFEDYVPSGDGVGVGEKVLNSLLHRYLEIEGIPPYVVSMKVIMPLLKLIKLVTQDLDGKVCRKGKLYHIVLGDAGIIAEPTYSSELFITVIAQLGGRDVLAKVLRALFREVKVLRWLRFGRAHRCIDVLLDLYTRGLRNRTCNHRSPAHSWPLSASH